MSFVCTTHDHAAQEIVNLHREIEGYARTTLDKAVRIGELLSGVKIALGHGNWLPWLQAKVGFSERSAQNYMRLHKCKEQLKSAMNADLSLSGCLALVAEPKHTLRDHIDVESDAGRETASEPTPAPEPTQEAEPVATEQEEPQEEQEQKKRHYNTHPQQVFKVRMEELENEIRNIWVFYPEKQIKIREMIFQVICGELRPKSVADGVPPNEGMNYAIKAINYLALIPRNDFSRNQAFNAVNEWIEKNR